MALCLSLVFFAPVWGAPADVLQSPAPLPGDDAPKTRDLKTTDATVATQTGALNYSYPIVVPPGRHGAQPSLALSYSSQAPVYGGIAQGWQLSIPEIKLSGGAGSLADRKCFDPSLPSAQEPANCFTSTMAGNKPLVIVTEDAPTDTARTYRAQYDDSYTRYQRLNDTEDAVWRVLTIDGTTHYFGEASRILNDGDVGAVSHPAHRYPLTRTVGPFGNTVVYTWRVHPLTGDFPARSIHLESIEYSTNPGAGLNEPFAKVEFATDSPDYCVQSKSPIGATEFAFDPDDGTPFDHQVWYEGARRLTSITTLVRDQPAQSLRKVRRYDLDYTETCTGGGPDGETCVCDFEQGAYRTLYGITEVGDPDGAKRLASIGDVRIWNGNSRCGHAMAGV